jgi:hypothetical protein
MNKQNILALALKPAMRVTKFHFGGAIIVMMLAVGLFAASAAPPSGGPTATRLVTGLEGAMGSTIGPDGALYVTEGAVGRISRVDPADRGENDVRQRSAESDPSNRHRWGD